MIINIKHLLIFLSFIILSFIWYIIITNNSDIFKWDSKPTLIKLESPSFIIGGNKRIISFNNRYNSLCAYIKNHNQESLCDQEIKYIIHVTGFIPKESEKMNKINFFVKTASFYDDSGVVNEYIATDISIEENYGYFNFKKYLLWFYFISSYIGLLIFFLQRKIKFWFSLLIS